MNSPVSFLTNLRQDRLQRSEMFSWNKIINALNSRGNINPFTTFKPSGWKCYKEKLAVRSSRYEARGSLESTNDGTLASWVMNQLLNVLIYTVQFKDKGTLYRSTMRSYQATYVDILNKYAYVLLVCAFVIHCPPCALSGIELYKKETVL